MSAYSLIALGLSAALLLWAFLVRRSVPDALLLLGTAAATAAIAARPWIVAHSALQIGLLPEVAAGAFGLLLLIWSFRTQRAGGHRQSLRLAGCAITLPLVALLAGVTLMAMLWR